MMLVRRPGDGKCLLRSSGRRKVKLRREKARKSEKKRSWETCDRTWSRRGQSVEKRIRGEPDLTGSMAEVDESN